jgi:gluconate 5-dehydrogenase
MANSLFSLEGRLALVTGSGQGIGFALARGLAEHGASVVLNGRDAARIGGAVEKLRDAGFKAHASTFDVTDFQAVNADIARIEAEIGAIDILVNNAGVQFRAPLEDFPEDQWERLFKTNVSGAFHAGKAVARHMIARGMGKIINIGSVQSRLARPHITPYSATKGGIVMLTQGMCADLGPHGIQANALAPGYFATELTKALVDDAEFSDWVARRTPAGRWGRVHELVGALVFLASSASDFVNGQSLYVDGGMTAVV